MPSSCINEFDASIALSEALQALEATYPDPPSSSKPSDVAVVRALRGGAIVLMVATLEQFMRSAIEEHLQPFTSGKTQRLLSSLPTDLQVASAFNSLELAMRGPRYGKNGSRGSRLPDVMIAAKRLAADSLDVSAFSVTGGNPNPDTLRELLKAIGLADPFARLRPAFEREWGKREATDFVKDKLEEVVTARHRVAHAPAALNISRKDVLEGTRFIRCLAIAIDATIKAHVATL